ncbi:hypothetical protein BH11ACT2_BH11ACT2_05220 [soil metagenome]
MSDREISAREVGSEPDAVSARVGGAGSVAGLAEISELLRVHDATRPRSTVARVFGASPLSLAGRAAFRSAMGEIEVGDALDLLAAPGSGWHVVHSIAVEEGAELDHLVIGPTGVYVVTTAAHPDGVVEASQRTFTVSDVRYPHIRNMEYEMGRVERLLSAAAGEPVEVSGILAVVEPKSLVVREAHRDVAVLPASTIVRWLSTRTRIISPADVEQIAAAARLASTWQVAVDAVPDGAALRERVDRLRGEVERAWSLQRLWATAITVAAAGAFIVVTYSILVAAIGTGHV